MARQGSHGSLPVWTSLEAGPSSWPVLWQPPAVAECLAAAPSSQDDICGGCSGGAAGDVACVSLLQVLQAGRYRSWWWCQEAACVPDLKVGKWQAAVHLGANRLRAHPQGAEIQALATPPPVYPEVISLTQCPLHILRDFLSSGSSELSSPIQTPKETPAVGIQLGSGHGGRTPGTQAQHPPRSFWDT